MQIPANSTHYVRKGWSDLKSNVPTTQADTGAYTPAPGRPSRPEPVPESEAHIVARPGSKARLNNRGYLAVLAADGGQARIDAFHKQLNGYLKTTPLWPGGVDKKV